MSARWPWAELGLKGKTDLRSVKRAYAKKLKTIDRNDPKAFQALRDALDAAKARATPTDTPRQPSMREAAAGVAPESAPQVTEDVISGQVFDPEGMSDRIDAEKAEAPDDFSPVLQQAPEYAPPDPIASVSNPWSDRERSGTDDEDAFFRDLSASFETGVWKIRQLEEVLNRDIAMDRDIRDRAENKLFETLRVGVVEDGRVVSNRIATVMETHFGWASDGIRFNKKFGWIEGSELVANDVAQSLRGGTPSRPSPHKEPVHGKPYRALTCAVMYVAGVFALRDNGLTEETFFFSAVFAAIVFALLWCAVIFLFYWITAIGHLKRIPYLGTRITTAWLSLTRSVSPLGALDAAMHRQGPRMTIVFCVTGVLTTAALIWIGAS